MRIERPGMEMHYDKSKITEKREVLGKDRKAIWERKIGSRSGEREEDFTTTDHIKSV